MWFNDGNSMGADMVKKLDVKNIEVGMVIERPIYRDNGTLLIPVGTVVTLKVIDLLVQHSVREVYIKMEEKFDNSKDEVKKTESFKIFNTGIIDIADDLKNDFKDLISNEKAIDANMLVEKVDQLFELSGNSIQLLDMIYCMRDYDDLTYGHSVNVAIMCKIMGGWLNLNEEEEKVLVLCGLLHDVGKLSIPQDIIGKAGKLTDEERNIITGHPQKGYEVLKPQNIDERIKDAAYQHHEKCDGSGYPRGLKSSQIEDFAKIVTIIDMYDAMTADRVYRKGMCPFKAIDIIIEEGYDKYDPKFLMLFLERISETYINKYVHLSNGQTGKIVMINKNDFVHPVVKVEDEYLDLSKDKTIKIEVVL